MNIGVIQGRLLPPVDNMVQEFPVDWRDEFSSLETLGLEHIEFIVTKKSFDDFKGLVLSDYVDRISSICCDNIIDCEFYKRSFLDEQLLPICRIASELGISNINIPLLEESSLCVENFGEFSENIISISSEFPELTFNFELESPLHISLALVNLSERFGFVYDTGNLNYIGVDHVEYINGIIHKIKNVHLKDRDSAGSHYPGTGTTDFGLIFDVLSSKGYDGLFTIQTKRGETGLELDTISKHFYYFKTLWQSSTKNKYE